MKLHFPKKISKLINSNTFLCIYLLILSLIIVFTYIRLFLIYNPEFVDDAWYLSFIYNKFIKKIPVESTFGSASYNFKFWGLTYAYIYLYILNFLGWTKTNAHFISLLFIFIGSFPWYFIVRSLTGEKKVAILFLLVLIISEPFLLSGNSSRPEAITFFFFSFLILLLIRDNFFFSGLLFGILIEIHPVAPLVGVYIFPLIYLKYKKERKVMRIIGYFITGTIVGLVYYILLHFEHLSLMPTAIARSVEPLNRFLLYEYFRLGIPHKLENVYYVFDKMRLIELLALSIAFLFSIYQFIKKQSIYPFIFCAASLIGLFLLPHHNSLYIVLFYWPFLLAMTIFFTRFRVLGFLFLLLFISTFLYRYSFYYRHAKKYKNFEHNVVMLRKQIPFDNRVILGSTNEWFSFMDRRFYPATYTMYFPENEEMIYLIKENDYRLNTPGGSGSIALKKYINNYYINVKSKSLYVNNQKFEILLLKKKN